MNEETKEKLESDSIKLYKMTKCYNWEIKLVGTLDEKQLERLSKINEQMKKTYGVSFDE